MMARPLHAVTRMYGTAVRGQSSEFTALTRGRPRLHLEWEETDRSVAYDADGGGTLVPQSHKCGL